MDEKELIPYGDNGLLDDRDYDLGGLDDFIDRIPTLYTPNINFSQYTKADYRSACTIFSGINAIAMLWDYHFSESEIKSIIDLAVSRGYVIGSGWSRSAGRMTVLKWRNDKFPDKQVLMFTIGLFDQDFRKLSQKKVPIGISINVNAAYWVDVRADLKVDNAPYPTGTGHATGCREGVFCVDSIPQKDVAGALPMVYTWQSEELMNKLRSGSNLRTDCTVFVKSEWMKADNTEEIARLEERAKRLTIDIAELGELIKSNSWYWEHTTVQAEKDKRHAFNEELRMQKAYNEGKLKVVQGCLKNLE